jgi:hypothetical protein
MATTASEQQQPFTLDPLRHHKHYQAGEGSSPCGVVTKRLLRLGDRHGSVPWS